MADEEQIEGEGEGGEATRSGKSGKGLVITLAMLLVLGGGGFGAWKFMGSADGKPKAEEKLPPRYVTLDPPFVVNFEADRLLVRAQTERDGVLVLSEVAYPGWVATVDGTPAPIYVANGLLRAVPLRAGTHTVELRFESPTLQIGVVVSLVAAALLAGCCVASLVVSGRRRRFP